ncbi:MAG: ATP-binding protein [Eubacterium sp.]|nr:ATP-binding protein [Eubacterium sp.]
MQRFLMEELVKWKDRKDHKPLLLSGARQVGKTWLMKEFGANYFKKTVYINFDKDGRLHDLLERTIDPKSILSAIAALYDIKPDPMDTLIIFDEVQEEPRALASLKYFCEEAPEYAVISAGSFMGIALRKGTTFPVGKVDSMTLYPLSFREFIKACEKEALCDLLESRDISLICSMKDEFVRLLKDYYIVGGMPEVVSDYIEHGDLYSCREKQENLIGFYRQDFMKHASGATIQRLSQVWDSLPSQLAKENKKFIYGVVKKGGRAKEFETAIQWLSDCGLIHKVYRISKPGIPLKGYVEISDFKIYMHDVGLLGAMSELPIESVVNGDRLFSEFKGAMTEQYVLQQMVSEWGITPLYYSAENSRGEIDFVIQKMDEVLPVEVKSAENLRAKSLKAFVEKFGLSRGVRISMSDYREQDWLTNYPLYAFMVL